MNAYVDGATPSNCRKGDENREKGRKNRFGDSGSTPVKKVIQERVNHWEMAQS